MIMLIPFLAFAGGFSEGRIKSSRLERLCSDPDLAVDGEVASCRFILAISIDMLSRALSVPSYLN